jgi:hypothetical protein
MALSSFQLLAQNHGNGRAGVVEVHPVAIRHKRDCVCEERQGLLEVLGLVKGIAQRNKERVKVAVLRLRVLGESFVASPSKKEMELETRHSCEGGQVNVEALCEESAACESDSEVML